MFDKTAAWYDALYSFKDYRKESAGIIERIEKEHPNARTILDVSCGTAEHDKYLAERYRVDGVDISPDFIRIAASKNPAGEYFCADMADFHLQKQYDVVLCLFSSIGYVKTGEKLLSTLRCFGEHLNPGGIVMVEPWFTPETWHPGEKVYTLTAETPRGSICRMGISEQQGKLSILNFHYLIGTPKGIEHVTERHELALFTQEEMESAFQKAGFKTIHDPEGLTGRGMYLARAQGA